MTIQPVTGRVEPPEPSTPGDRHVDIAVIESDSVPTYGATCPICGGPALPKQGGGGVE